MPFSELAFFWGSTEVSIHTTFRSPRQRLPPRGPRPQRCLWVVHPPDEYHKSEGHRNQGDSTRTEKHHRAIQANQQIWRMSNSKNEIFLFFLVFTVCFFGAGTSWTSPCALYCLVPFGTASPPQLPKQATPGLASDALQCSSSRAGVSRNDVI